MLSVDSVREGACRGRLGNSPSIRPIQLKNLPHILLKMVAIQIILVR